MAAKLGLTICVCLGCAGGPQGSVSDGAQDATGGEDGGGPADGEPDAALDGATPDAEQPDAGSDAAIPPEGDTWASVTTVGAPSGRQAHSAVWTGSEMIVWGGCSYSGSGPCVVLGDGARYDPVDDTWEPMSEVGAPEARRAHRASWTGTEMIVWGGATTASGGYVATGGRYDPMDDSWEPMSTGGAPEPRSEHAQVWFFTDLVVWGGWNGAALATGGRYSPATDMWAPISMVDVPDARAFPTEFFVGSNIDTAMLVWGGEASGLFDVLATGARYGLGTDEWTPISEVDAPAGRAYHGAVWTGSEMIVWGGRSESGTTLGDGGRYWLAADTWLDVSETGAPEAREFFSAVWTGAEMIVWGGATVVNEYGDTVTGGRYDPFADTWEPTSTDGAPDARRYHTTVWSGSEMIVWGGQGTPATLGTGARYTP